MKTTLVALSLLFATSAFAQSSMSAPVYQPLQFSEHTDHAAPHATAEEQDLWSGPMGVHIAQGELPLWEVAPKIHETPLGDVARAQKKEHQADKKAHVVWEN